MMPSTSPPLSAIRKWQVWLDPAASFKYLGIYQAIAADIASDRLLPGDALPSQRVVAKTLGVDLTTVTKAYALAREEGLIETRTGSGTCVAGMAAARFSDTAQHTPLDLSKNSPPRAAGQEINALIASDMARAFANGGDIGRFNYQETGGNWRHRLTGTQWLQSRINGLDPEQLILTSGAQSALFAICHLVRRQSKCLAVGQFCYPGIHTIARQLDLKLVPVAMDEHGLIPEDFERACQRHAIGALYVVPNLDNPTTATLPEPRRHQLAHLARKHDVALIEDDPYFNIAENGMTPLAVLAPERTWHIATLSKCATPALRLAYLVAPDAEHAQRVAATVQAMTMMVSPLFAELASHWIETDALKKLTHAIRQENAARLQLAQDIFKQSDFSAPAQGAHVWLQLPSRWQALDFAHQAERQSILILPASSFSPVPQTRACEAVRISLGAAPDRATLAEALERLNRILTESQPAYTAIV